MPPLAIPLEQLPYGQNIHGKTPKHAVSTIQIRMCHVRLHSLTKFRDDPHGFGGKSDRKVFFAQKILF
jgi:hypothetical protein